MLAIQKNLNTWILAWLPPIVWGVFIFIFSSQSSLPGPDDILLDFIFKKISHMFVFAVMYLLVWHAIQRTLRPKTAILSWSIPLVVCLFYAAMDELHQSFTPGRSATLRDVGYDTLGMLVAGLWWYRYI